jgi:hypothetical protein
MAKSIPTNQTFSDLAEVEAFFGAKWMECGLASEWTSIDVPHVLVAMDRGRYGMEQWFFVFEPPIEGAGVPSFMADRVDCAITAIREANKSLAESRSLDIKFRGEGRYESDWFRNGIFPEGAIASVTKFLALAYRNGVDGCAWLIDRGYEAPLGMSDAAREWMD